MSDSRLCEMSFCVTYGNVAEVSSGFYDSETGSPDMVDGFICRASVLKYIVCPWLGH